MHVCFCCDNFCNGVRIVAAPDRAAPGSSAGRGIVSNGGQPRCSVGLYINNHRVGLAMISYFQHGPAPAW